jgi:hypothetical protein
MCRAEQRRVSLARISVGAGWAVSGHTARPFRRSRWLGRVPDRQRAAIHAPPLIQFACGIVWRHFPCPTILRARNYRTSATSRKEVARLPGSVKMTRPHNGAARTSEEAICCRTSAAVASGLFRALPGYGKTIRDC